MFNHLATGLHTSKRISDSQTRDTQPTLCDDFGCDVSYSSSWSTESKWYVDPMVSNARISSPRHVIRIIVSHQSNWLYLYTILRGTPKVHDTGCYTNTKEGPDSAKVANYARRLYYSTIHTCVSKHILCLLVDNRVAQLYSKWSMNISLTETMPDLFDSIMVRLLHEVLEK